ncbi:MAG: Holliday junction ATP-dependent DNA helicase RuvA [Actinomycetota bacterium]|nr:Holliday junction ATP-dependent DNA helicase RuvA [Actinomycetota bacterium]
MIGYLRGAVIEQRVVGETAVEITVDVAGVGYRVTVAPRVVAHDFVIDPSRSLAPGTPAAAESTPNGKDQANPRTAAAANHQPNEVALSIHTHVREGSITLYGFANPEERRAFELLLSAHGVGPSLAMAIVSVHGPGRLLELVANDDVDALTLVPGVGRKTAMRLLLDLKSRLGELDTTMLGTAAAMAGGRDPSPAREVAAALVQLGYGQDEIRAVMASLPLEGSVEDLLRSALRDLAPRR